MSCWLGFGSCWASSPERIVGSAREGVAVVGRGGRMGSGYEVHGRGSGVVRDANADRDGADGAHAGGGGWGGGVDGGVGCGGCVDGGGDCVGGVGHVPLATTLNT